MSDLSCLHYLHKAQQSQKEADRLQVILKNNIREHKEYLLLENIRQIVKEELSKCMKDRLKEKISNM